VGLQLVEDAQAHAVVTQQQVAEAQHEDRRGRASLR
jgi:hypothetical protein